MTESRSEKLLRKRVVLDRTGVSSSTFYNLIKRGVIKPGVPIGARMKGWPESEIDLFVRSCIDARDNSADCIDIRETAAVEASSRTPALLTKNHKSSSVSVDTLDAGKGIGVAHRGKPVRMQTSIVEQEHTHG